MALLQSCNIYPQLCGLVPFKTIIKYGWHLSWRSSCEVSPVHLDSVNPSVKFICHPAEIEWIQRAVWDLAERNLFLLQCFILQDLWTLEFELLYIYIHLINCSQTIHLKSCFNGKCLSKRVKYSLQTGH